MVQEAIFLSIYYKYPLRRDLGDCLLLTSESQETDVIKTKNYVVKKNATYTLFLNAFKTAKKDGVVKCRKEFALSEKVLAYIDWVVKSPSNQTNSLLINQRCTPMTDHIFAKLFAKTMGKYTGVESRINDWRSAKVSHTFRNDTPLSVREELADFMCNSVITQMTHYEKKG